MEYPSEELAQWCKDNNYPSPIYENDTDGSFYVTIKVGKYSGFGISINPAIRFAVESAAQDCLNKIESEGGVMRPRS